MITIENLDKVLKSAQLDAMPSQANGETHFDRNRHFVIDGIEYKIQWWNNISYLYVGLLTIPFDNIWIDANSPRRHLSKMDLRFSYRGETYGAILNLVNWESPK